LGGDYAAQLTERYNREARAYRELWAPSLRKAGLHLLDALVDPRVEVVLDIASGVGCLLPDLARAFPGAAVHGVARSRGMLAQSPADFPRAAMDARCLGFSARSVDRALLAFVLFHLEDPVEALRDNT